MGGQDKRNAGAEIAILYFFLKATAHVSPSFFFRIPETGVIVAYQVA